MPTAAPGPAAEAAAPAATTKKRSPWTWPLIALIALLLIVLGATVFALVSNDTPAPAPTTPSATGETPQTPTPKPSTPTPTSVNVDALNLIGMDCTAAKQKAEDAGLTNVSCMPGDPAPTAEEVGKVYRYEPQANVPFAQQFTLTAYAEQTALPAPSGAARIQVGGATVSEVKQGTVAQVVWDAYTCPSGTGSVTGYNLSVLNGTFDDGTTERTFQAGDRPVAVTVNGEVTRLLTVQYTVSCGDRESPKSPEAAASITAGSTGTPTPPAR